MGEMVKPKVFLVGYTTMDKDGMNAYLEAAGNTAFLEAVNTARRDGLSDGEILCSFYAKLCYKSLTTGHNLNISRVRDIADNLDNCNLVGHQSVFEHCSLNFVITDCSRVFTHELVRHRVGTAISQTSGRYCRLNEVSLVFDPALESVASLCDGFIKDIEEKIYRLECYLGLRDPPVDNLGTRWIIGGGPWPPNDKLDFATKKKLTSAVRRIAPNGQANEVGWSVNLRSLRHIVQLRTSRHAEWEIRYVFAQIYQLVKDRWPTLFAGATVEDVDGLPEISGLRMQPYEPKKLSDYTESEINEELKRRHHV